MDGLLSRVASALRAALAEPCLPENAPLVLAISGGVDSLALLDVLARLLPPERLTVAHLDHGLRPTSAEEADVVMEAAAAYGLRGVAGRVDVAALARGVGVEAVARAARYDFLATVARQVGAPAVVAAHNADDQAETVLMHLLRGSGASGLRGMGPAAPLPGHGDLWLLRPLLGVGRAELESYCRSAGLRPIHDASNVDTTFLRNRLRHELLPALETYNPQIRARLREMAAVIAAEDDLLTALEATSWETVCHTARAGSVVLSRTAWLAEPVALRRRLLRRAVVACAPSQRDVGFQAIDAARLVAETGRTGSRATLPGGLELRVGYDRLEIAAAGVAAADDWPQLLAPETALPVPGSVALANGWRLTAAECAPPDLAALTSHADPWTAYVALASDATLIVRGRRSGERIRPLGLGGERKLKDVMIDRKIPAAARPRWSLVATVDHAIWLPGHILDDRARVTPGSARVVCLRCLRDDGLQTTAGMQAPD